MNRAKPPLYLSQLAARILRQDSRPIDVRYVGADEQLAGLPVLVKPAPDRPNTWFFTVETEACGFAAVEQEIHISLTGDVEIRDTWGENQQLHLSIVRPLAAEDLV
jgi:hypothetical protein